MTTSSFRYRSLVGYAVPVSVLCMVVASTLDGYGRFSQIKGRVADQRQEVKQDMKEAAKMVVSIANHNTPPEIVRRRRARPRSLPLFSKDYDWKEDDRVQKALNRLARDTSIELWETLVQKTNDRHYCITTCSWSSDDAKIYSVGTTCRILAYDRLCNVFERHLPSVAPYACPVRLESIQEDLMAWRKHRKEKALYQLQIEVCEMAIRELRKVDTEILSDNEKTEAKKKIEAEISELRRSKTPFLGKRGIPRAYPQRAANRVREAFEAGALEDLEIRLNK